MRLWVLLALTCGCGATLETRELAPDADPDDQIQIVDATPPDAPIDARTCAGADGSATTEDGTCLLLFTTPRSFDDASNACAAIGTRLAILDTPERDTIGRALAGTRQVFIGLTDQVVEGQFRWVDASALVFSNFATGEPNDANGAFAEDCIILDGNRAGQWDDRPCATDPVATVPGTYGYLCQF
ncbi:MAG TPA: C-type lectin domain-containing protein [Kofleriaceae bacterium]|nr:C-type lectin domain-containing protein [Kofleriaceae bacterium]